MQRGHAWLDAGVEPDVDDLLADPLVHLVLRRDGLTVDDVRWAVADARLRLERRRLRSGHLQPAA